MNKKITREGHLRAFIETVSDMTLDPYQVNFVNDCWNNKRVVGIFSRQTGKTTMMSLFAIYKATQIDKLKILIIAPTDRQAGELFARLRGFAENSGLIKQFIKNSTQREITFTNDSYIRAMPTGDFGHNIRGQTADLIIMEESSYIKSDIVNQVIMPMIAATNGDIIQIGTPFFKNHFYEASLSDKYKVHQYDYTHCPRITKDFIEEQKANLTTIEFTMEYMAQFIDETDCFFNSELIKSCVQEYELNQPIHPKGMFVAGVDFAGMGEDEASIIILEQNEYTHESKIKIQNILTAKQTKQTQTVGTIKILNIDYKFRKIYCDNTGIGEGPVDFLKEHLPSVVEGIRFTLQSKQDMYSNLKILMESGRLIIPNHKKLIMQLMDLRYEATGTGQLKIHHSERGHDDLCFIAGTRVLTDKGQINIEELKIGDKVMTRKGYRKIVATGSRKSEVITRFGITGTPDHPFITKKGIKKFMNVSVLDLLYVWNEKQLSIMERNIIDTQTVKEDIYEYIIGDIQVGKNPLKHCIEIYGKKQTEKYLKDMLFITKTEIHLITILKIFKLCLKENINLNIVPTKKERKMLERTYENMHNRKRKNGINQRKGVNGINNIIRKVCVMLRNISIHVKNVIKSTKVQGKQKLNSVQINVNKETGGEIMKRNVYNITVEGENEYFANNILVHNCDALALAALHFKPKKRANFTIA